MKKLVIISVLLFTGCVGYRADPDYIQRVQAIQAVQKPLYVVPIPQAHPQPQPATYYCTPTAQNNFYCTPQ